MALARCQCHEHWSAVEDATGEDDVPDAVADLPSPRQPRRHEVENVQESFLRVAEPDDPHDFRDVSTNWEAPACGIRILSFVE